MIAKEEDIKKFEAALLGAAPAWDPDWSLTKALLELVRVQSERILTLEEEKGVDDFSQKAVMQVMRQSLKGGLDAKVDPGKLTDAQAQEAVASLNAATAAAASGAQIVQYASSVLKFVVKILV